MRRIAAAAAVTTLAVGLIATPVAARGRQAQGDAAPTVQAGINDPKQPDIAVLQFLPSELKVAVGTPVTWTWKGAIEPHSVTFVPRGTAPPNDTNFGDYLTRTDPASPYDGTTLANSGLQPLLPGADAPDFAMTFGAPGSYTYYCVIHPKMIGTVDVVDSGSGAQTAAQVRAAGKAQQRRWLAEGRAAKAKLERRPPEEDERRRRHDVADRDGRVDQAHRGPRVRADTGEDPHRGRGRVREPVEGAAHGDVLERAADDHEPRRTRDDDGDPGPVAPAAELRRPVQHRPAARRLLPRAPANPCPRCRRAGSRSRCRRVGATSTTASSTSRAA